MLFHLALALGEWDVDKMARQMPLTLFDEWLAYFRQQPLPWKRDDYHAALLAMVVRNTIVGTHTRRPRMMKLKDFMLEFGSAVMVQKTPGEIYQDIKTALFLSVPRDGRAAEQVQQDPAPTEGNG